MDEFHSNIRSPRNSRPRRGTNGLAKSLCLPKRENVYVAPQRVVDACVSAHSCIPSRSLSLCIPGYTVRELLFRHSPTSIPIPGKDLSHADYFRQRKGVVLQHPIATRMVAVLGRREQVICLPAELVCGNELDPSVRQALPKVARFDPPTRHAAIERIKEFLVPGAQRSSTYGDSYPRLVSCLPSTV